MSYIRVVYNAKKYVFDYVSADQLEILINRDEISHFYRPSEERWVNVRCDQTRGSGGSYHGPERRIANNKSNLRHPEDGFSKHQGNETDWFEKLWRHIEGL